jgi:hypothetical protein
MSITATSVGMDGLPVSQPRSRDRMTPEGRSSPRDGEVTDKPMTSVMGS